MLLTIKPTSRLPNKYWQKPTAAVTVTPSIITCSWCFSLRFQLPPQTVSRDVTLSIKLDQNSLVSCSFLCRLDCLIMWMWRRFSAKPAVTSLKGDMLTRARFLRLLFFLFLPWRSRHKRCKQLFWSDEGQFRRLIPSNGLRTALNMTDHRRRYLQSRWLCPHSHRLSCGHLPPHTHFSAGAVRTRMCIIDRSPRRGI